MPRKTWQIAMAAVLTSASVISFAQTLGDVVSQRLEAFVEDTNAISVNVALVKSLLHDLQKYATD